MSGQLLASDLGSQSSVLDEPHACEPHEQHVERLFREHNESLLRFLRARLHSQEEAKEVAQDAYAQLLGRTHPETVRYLQGYLYRTAANLATNRLKQRAQRRRDNELILFETEDFRSPERVCEADRDVDLMRRALSELPANCLEAFQLVKIDGLSSDEAAQRLHLHPRRVRRFVARALAHCLAVLEPAAAH